MSATFRIGTAPRTVLRKDSVNAECTENLRNMCHGDAFKSMAIPVVLGRSVQRMSPIMGVTLFLCSKGVIEDGIEIDQ